MNAESEVSVDEEVRRRRVELAPQAFREFFAQCFWSYRPDAEIQEADIPWVIRELRHNGGAQGYQAVAEICRDGSSTGVDDRPG